MVELEQRESEKRDKMGQRIDAVAVGAKNAITPYKVGMEFNYFRYTVAFLLIAMKLGLFTYLPVNPLADTSWWIVLLPAYAIEVVMLGIVIAAIGIMLAVAALGMIGIMVSSFFQNRKLNKVVAALKRTPVQPNDVMVARTKALLRDMQLPLDN